MPNPCLFYPPLFQLYSLEPSTFGHDEMPSSALFSVDSENSLKLQEKTTIQFVARTNRPNGAVLFIGDKSLDDVGTFVSTQISNGSVNGEESASCWNCALLRDILRMKRIINK